MQRQGKPVPLLGALLVEKGYIQAEVLQQILSRQKKGTPQNIGYTTRRSHYSAIPSVSHGNIDISEFTTDKILGDDEFTTSYYSKHLKTGAQVILRVQKKIDSNNDVNEFFAFHAESAKKLCHPHLQRVLTVGHIEDRHFYAADFIEGISLRRLIAGEKRLPWGWVCQVAKQVADALVYAHANSFVHGEVRPSNILISRSGNACLCGFGSAVHAISNLQHMYREGDDAPFYLAPEQALPDHPITSSADVYSLGATIFRAITGISAYAGDDLEDLLLHISQDDPTGASTIIPGIPPALDTLLAKMLIAEPEMRISSEQVAKSLAYLLNLPELDNAELRAYHEALIGKYSLSYRIPAGVSTPHEVIDNSSRSDSLWHLLRMNVIPLLSLFVLAFLTCFLYSQTQYYRVYVRAADKAYAAGDLAMSLRLLQQAEGERPNHPQLLQRLIGVAEEAGVFELAEQAQARLLMHEKFNTAQGREHLADIQMWQNHFEPAIENFRLALQINPDNPIRIRQKMAEAMLWMGNYHGSAKLFRELLHDNPSNADYLLGVARSDNYACEYIQALSSYSTYLKQRPNDESILFEYAECLAAAGQFIQAAKVYERFAEQNALSPAAKIARARNLLWGKDYQAAITAFESLRALSPNDPQIIRSLSVAYEGRGEIAKAIELQEELSKQKSATFAERINLGHLYQGAKRFRDAAALFTELLKERPGDPLLWLDAGRSLIWNGELVEAVPFLKRAYEIDEENTVILKDYARLLLWVKQPSKAIPLLERLIKSGQADIDMQLELARLYYAAGDRAKALQIYNVLREKTENRSDFIFAMSELEIQLGLPDTDLRFYPVWAKAHETDWPGVRRIAELLRAANRHKEAFPLYQRLIGQFTKDEKLLLQAAEEAAWAGYPQEQLIILERLNQLQKSRGDAK